MITNLQTARNSYMETVVKNTSNCVELLIMLYDGAIDFLNKGKKAIQENNLQEKIDNLFRVTRIIEELLASLNKNAGGKIAENLEELYIFSLQEISKANLKNDIKSLEVVEKILLELRDAWRQIK
ncbi:MAG: flagellar export chaperone FliS [Proteobacteria bacterium]|nr:flagellar export chaperone FliS [Pseudomonadota bacterium]